MMLSTCQNVLFKVFLQVEDSKQLTSLQDTLQAIKDACFAESLGKFLHCLTCYQVCQFIIFNVQCHESVDIFLYCKGKVYSTDINLLCVHCNKMYQMSQFYSACMVYRTWLRSGYFKKNYVYRFKITKIESLKGWLLSRKNAL